MSDAISKTKVLECICNAINEIVNMPTTHDNARETHACDNERTEKHGDLISRKAAIDALTHKWDGMVISVFDVLKELPSAEPEQKIYAKMSDEEFEKWLYEHGICHPDIHESISCKTVQLLIDYAINELPNTEQERQGRWLKAYGEHEAMGIRPFYRYCSRCNEATGFPYKYCPNCGARMDGDSE